jgi:hypothetical protein
LRHAPCSFFLSPVTASVGRHPNKKKKEETAVPRAPAWHTVPHEVMNATVNANKTERTDGEPVPASPRFPRLNPFFTTYGNS